MRINVYIKGQHRSVPSVMAGFKRHGFTPRLTRDVSPCDLAVVWGYHWESSLRYQQSARRLLVLERGYVGTRKQWTSIGYDGLNGRADFCCCADPPSDRWARHFSSYLKPWRGPNVQGPVLVIGQVPGDKSLRGLDIHDWCVSTAKLIEQEGRAVQIRWHPKDKSPPVTLFDADGSVHLADALAGAHHVVTYNSNTAVDAVLAGVPAFAADHEGSMAQAVAAHYEWLDPHEPTEDARRRWANGLAYAQWSIMERDGAQNEVANGDFWDHLKFGMRG